MSVPFGVVIPARYGSSRLPGKPLRLIGGRPMVLRVVELAERSGAEFVWVATDDERIAESVGALGVEVIMTSTEHPTGTDRLAEVVRIKGLSSDTILVNVQGDEPLLPPELVGLVARSLAERPQAGIATLAAPLHSGAELLSPHVVKVVLDNEGYARMFSRAPLPWARDAFSSGVPDELPEGVPFLRHIGLYAYRARTLTQLAALESTSLERAESLEQLRALGHGVQIFVAEVSSPPPHGVDTEEDLTRVDRFFLAT